MKYLLIFTLLFLTVTAHAQLTPGFDAQEYMEMLRISRQHLDTLVKGDHVPPPQQYHRIYSSPVGPLKNKWDLWINAHKTAVISIRGSTPDGISWLENFYAAMVPATGQLHISNTNIFNYHLSDDPRATVHIGWLLGMADIAPTAVEQVKQLYTKQGIKSFIIMGHSQGAAIAYLLRSYIATLQQQGTIPADAVFKTYCSAPPKPGNTYYAYTYDYLTRNGWGISVINAADWVPETPFSVQTLNDFNPLNPFGDISQVSKKQSFIARLYIKHIYNQLKNPPEEAVRHDQKYLGHTVYKFIKKTLPQFQEPRYADNNLYTHCGTEIILMPDDAYRKKYLNNPKKIFTHHMFEPYYDLTEREYAH